MTTFSLIPRRTRGGAFPAGRAVRSFDDLIDDLWSGFAFPGGPSVTAGFTPRIDVSETGEHVRVVAELPGLERKDFEVTVEADVLTLKGEKRPERDAEAPRYRHVETRSGRFERRVVLPCEVDAGAARASFQNGLLEIELPKAKQARSRTIPVTSG